MSVSLLAVRGKGQSSLILKEFDSKVQYQEILDTPRTFRELPNRPCRAMKFSNDGSLFVFCNSERTVVRETATLKEVASFALPKTSAFYFSPNDEILCTLEPFFTSKDLPEGKKNLKLWNTKTWECLIELKQKSQKHWHPVWFGDSEICGRLMGSSIFFYSGNNFEKFVTKLHIDKLENFSLSSSKSPPQRVACFVRGAKGAPSSVKIYNYPNFERDEVIASKSFFKADTVVITWNAKGNAILIKAATEVDTSGASYYGEQSLHYMNCSGDTSIVQLPKKGPIYDVAWDPDSTKFCVTYGFMPAKASIFNHKCNVVHDFGPSPKNMCIYNPHGNLLLLAGFGNLRGNIEVWHNDEKNIKQIAQLQAPDTTHLEWCADGEHFITATTTPRLRVNNGYKLWHYASDSPIAEQKWETELNEVMWQSFPSDYFKSPKIGTGAMTTPKFTAAAKPKAYVPPHARNDPSYNPAKFMQDEEEVAQAEQNLSKSALKNKKKREAAKKKKEQQQIQPQSNLSQSQQDAVAMAKYLLNNDSQPKAAAPTNMDNDKKIKNLKKKIQTIEKLKLQQKEGKQLEKNQIEKIATENELRMQLQALELS